MQHYIATYWDGTAWTDLHSDPLRFREAEDKATSALLSGRGTTRLRPARQPDYLTTISPEQIDALHTYATQYGKDWKHHLGIKWHCATAPALLHRLRDTHGPSWLVAFKFPEDDIS